MGWQPDSDPGPAPDGWDEPLSIVGITKIGEPSWTDDFVATMLDAIERQMPDAESVVAEARLRWAARPNAVDFEAWLLSALEPFLPLEDRDVDAAFEDECDCGAALIVPGPWTGRGVFVCDDCQLRWGIEVSEDGSAISWRLREGTST